MSFSKPDESVGKATRKLADPGKLWLSVVLPNLALEVFSRGQVAEDQAIVVTEKQQVVHRNSAAANLGIQPGHNMDTAYTLSEQVVSFERDLDKEFSSLAHLAQWAYQFTPNVSLKAPDALLLDITGCLNLFRGLANLADTIRNGLIEKGHQPVIASHCTPQAALLAARATAPGSLHTSLFTSLFTSAGNLPALDPVPVSMLPVEMKIITGLQQLGLASLGQVLALPRSGLARRFGAYFVDYLERLVGDKPDPQKFITPSASFYHDITFLADVSNLEALAFSIKRLLGEFADFLTVRQMQVNHFTWHLSHRDHGRQSFSIYLASPANDKKMFQALTQLKLDQISSVREVDNIALSARQFFPADNRPGDLFSGKGFGVFNADQGNDEQRNELLNLLRTRLGPGKVFGLTEANDHRPEKAWRKVALHRKDYWQAGDMTRVVRPAYLLQPPRALNVIDGVPCLGGKLTLIKGPERIDYGWWDQPINKPLTRDYYVAKKQDGSLYWVFEHVPMGRWYLHGIFS